MTTITYKVINQDIYFTSHDTRMIQLHKHHAIQCPEISKKPITLKPQRTKKKQPKLICHGDGKPKTLKALLHSYMSDNELK